MFFCEFFKIIKGNFFIKHRATFSECWRLEKSSWLLVILKDIILNDSILMDLFMECKNFIFNLFTRERRNSWKFSDIFSLLSIFFSYLIIVDHSHFSVAWFFSIFVLCHFGPGWSNGWSNGVRKRFLITFVLLWNISWRERCWLKIFSDWDVLFVQFVLVMYKS